MIKHAILVNPALRGVEYGMLRDFEDEIARITSAVRVEILHRNVPRVRRVVYGSFLRKFAPALRRFAPKARIPQNHREHLKVDVLWAILMGPSDFLLDAYRGWSDSAGKKILYLFDTFESQIPAINRILTCARWDLTITSFHGAVPMLEERTQRKWYAVPQGVIANRFQPGASAERLIHFSSYGRRLDWAHRSLLEYCRHNSKYYDYTTSAWMRNDVSPQENYTHYAWHLAHSLFSICWPVEMTSPGRVSTFSPVTCRWFETAASGAVIVGKPPAEPGFSNLFGRDLVVPLEVESPSLVSDQWEDLWNRREILLKIAAERRAEMVSQWTWDGRIYDILALLGLSTVNVQKRDSAKQSIC